MAGWFVSVARNNGGDSSVHCRWSSTFRARFWRARSDSRHLSHFTGSQCPDNSYARVGPPHSGHLPGRSVIRPVQKRDLKRLSLLSFSLLSLPLAKFGIVFGIL